MRRLGSKKVYQKKKKKVGLSFKKNGDDVTAQKPMTSFKQVPRHMKAFFEIKSTCPINFPKKRHNAIMNFLPNFMFTL
jgi:fibrillarin-like rRNA methylase